MGAKKNTCRARTRIVGYGKHNIWTPCQLPAIAKKLLTDFFSPSNNTPHRGKYCVIQWHPVSSKNSRDLIQHPFPLQQTVTFLWDLLFLFAHSPNLSPVPGPEKKAAYILFWKQQMNVQKYLNPPWIKSEVDRLRKFQNAMEENSFKSLRYTCYVPDHNNGHIPKTLYTLLLYDFIDKITQYSNQLVSIKTYCTCTHIWAQNRTKLG